MEITRFNTIVNENKTDKLITLRKKKVFAILAKNSSQKTKPEETEDKMEVVQVYYVPRSRKRKGKHRWICKRSGHLKAFCPSLRCFYCSKPGHTIAHCTYRILKLFENRKQLKKEIIPYPEIYKFINTTKFEVRKEILFADDRPIGMLQEN